MSDDEFDDSLLDDYKTEKGSIRENESEQDKEGSLGKGLLIGIGITILLELGVGLALNVQTNLVHRYIAYMLGIVPIFVTAIFTRSTLKMFFVGAPVLLITSFGLPLLLPSVFSGLMTPFLTLLPIINTGSDVLTRLGQTPEGTGEIITLINQWGIALDFIFGVIVGGFAAIGLSGIVKLVSNKPGILSIFSFVFSMLFLIIGVIILPYFLVITTGVAHFGMSFAVGGALLGEGTQIAADPDGNFTRADELFAEAQDWFSQTEQMLEGLQALGFFNLIASSNENVRIIVENGVVLMSAAVDLAQGIAPALAGFGAMSRGMETALGTFNETSTSLELAQTNDTEKFENSLNQIERGFSNFTQAIPEIRSAIDKLDSDVNRQELETALQEQGAGNVNEQLNLIFTSLPLLDISLSVFSNTNGTGLIDDPDQDIEDDSQRAPLIHLLLGAKKMNEVQKKIGGNSDFRGTGPLFAELNYHLEFVVNALDEDNNQAVGDLQELDLGENAPEQVLDLKDQITGTVNFLRDAGNTTISIGNFGIIASPTLRSMNETLSFLTESDNFTSIEQSEYNNAIAVFDGNSTLPYGIVGNATRMQNQASNVNSQTTSMETTSNAGDYGFFNDPAVQFIDEFQQFNLTKNADNFKYMSLGFSSMLKGVKDLTIVNQKLLLVEGNVTIVETEIQNTQDNVTADDANGALTAIQNANTAVSSVQTSIVTTNDTLQISKSHLNNASINFNKTKDMPQLDQTSVSLTNIAGHMQQIQVGNGTRQGLTGIDYKLTMISGNTTEIENLVNDGDITVSDDTQITEDINHINNDLTEIRGELAFIDDQFQEIQIDIKGISIDQ